MKLICLMPCRNEDWIIGLSARAVLMWVDHLVVLDHASTDDSSRILRAVQEEHPGRVTVLVEDSPVWEEMRHRQRMLDEARNLGATHIAMIDADEVLSGQLLLLIRDWYVQIPTGGVFQLPWLALRDNIHTRITDGVWGPWQRASCGIRNEPHWHWTARDGYDFHHRHPMGATPRWCSPPQAIQQGTGLMHLQFVSTRRLLAKQALYKMTEVIRWPGRDNTSEINKRYDYAGIDSHRAAVAQMSPAAWWPYAQLMAHLCVHAEPWQERECKRLWAEHGARKFQGLDLYGVCE
jgi:glycosyl transferase family 2